VPRGGGRWERPLLPAHRPPLNATEPLDAVVTGGTEDENTDTISYNRVILNQGDGTFGDSNQVLGEEIGRAVDLADVDADGDLDAFIARTRSSALFLNDGDGTFADSGQELPAAVDVALGDLIPTPRVAQHGGEGDNDVAAARDGEALSPAELLDDGALPVDGPAGTQQPVTLDAATALGTGPNVEDLVVAPETVVA
jgi:hypothetical protein